MTAPRTDAIVQDAAEVRKLSGLSGAQVFLMTKDGRHWFVRKGAKTPDHSARLRGQARKQLAFGKATQEFITTPHILDEGRSRRPLLLRHGIRPRP